MTKNKGRVVGLDVHPDSFAGAVVEGRDPANAVVSSTSTRVAILKLTKYGKRSGFARLMKPGFFIRC